VYALSTPKEITPTLPTAALRAAKRGRKADAIFLALDYSPLLPLLAAPHQSGIKLARSTAILSELLISAPPPVDLERLGSDHVSLTR